MKSSRSISSSFKTFSFSKFCFISVAKKCSIFAPPCSYRLTIICKWRLENLDFSVNSVKNLFEDYKFHKQYLHKKLRDSETYNLFYGILDNSGSFPERRNLRYFLADLRDLKNKSCYQKRCKICSNDWIDLKLGGTYGKRWKVRLV